MIKSFCVAVMIFGCSVGYSDSPEKVAKLSSRVILENTDGYFALSDGSLWKVVGFSKRWRTLSEWWNNVQLTPKNYECVPGDWHLGTQIEIYAKNAHLNANEANASNQESLKQCSHLLVNTRTEQTLFAIALEPSEAIVQLFQDAHGDGYRKGFFQGRSDHYQSADSIYEDGYKNGYQKGYSEGYQKAHQEETARR
jgi:hypothetical protein